MDAQKEGPDMLSKATTGYNAAIQLMVYEGNLIWNRYNAMLVANTIVLTLASSSLTTDWKTPKILMVALPFAGVALCCIWLYITKRGFDYHKYWLLSARELEEQYLTPPVTTLQRGAPYSVGKAVEIQLAGKPERIQMRPDSSFYSAEVLAYGPISIFVILYCVELAILWHHFTP